MIDMTGLTEFTLRGWELRYGAFEPTRTETARRQYSSHDLQKAILLRELLRRDRKIGEIAGLSVRNLNKLIAREIDSQPVKVSRFKNQIETIMSHLALQKWDKLEDSFYSTLKRLQPLTAINDFIVPIAHEMGRKTSLGHLSISQEHILSALLKQSLHSLTQSQPNHSGPKIVIASPEGDYHELGILIAHAMASQLKVRSLYVGPNTPKKDLCETGTRFEATHILLSATVTRAEGAKDDFYSFVHFLDQNMPKQTTFWFGGRSCETINLKRKTVVFNSLTDLQQELIELSPRKQKSTCHN